MIAYAWQISDALVRVDGGRVIVDFSTAVCYNGHPFSQSADLTRSVIPLSITSFVMDQQGDNDGDNWIWTIRFDNGETWIAEGGCDYTGWDCRSSLDWSPMVAS